MLKPCHGKVMLFYEVTGCIVTDDVLVVVVAILYNIADVFSLFC